jgi:hypothetical protein
LNPNSPTHFSLPEFYLSEDVCPIIAYEAVDINSVNSPTSNKFEPIDLIKKLVVPSDRNATQEYIFYIRVTTEGGGKFLSSMKTLKAEDCKMNNILTFNITKN